MFELEEEATPPTGTGLDEAVGDGVMSMEGRAGGGVMTSACRGVAVMYHGGLTQDRVLLEVAVEEGHVEEEGVGREVRV